MHDDQPFACRLAPGLSWLTRTPSLAYWALTILYGLSFWGSLVCQDTPQQVRPLHDGPSSLLHPQLKQRCYISCFLTIGGLMLQGSFSTKQSNQQTKILNGQTRPMDTKVLSVETTAPVIKRLGCQVKAHQSIIGVACVSSQMGQKDTKHKLT